MEPAERLVRLEEGQNHILTDLAEIKAAVKQVSDTTTKLQLMHTERLATLEAEMREATRAAQNKGTAGLTAGLISILVLIVEWFFGSRGV
jgi:hypothetical protein